MKITRAVAAITLLFVPVAASCRGTILDQASSTPITMGRSYAIRSAVLGDTRELNVWLPIGYEKSNDRYPVIYLLDGALDQDFQHIAGLGNLASLSQTFGPFIVVGVQTRMRIAELTSRPKDARYLAAFPESGGADRFRKFFQTEVIPFVQTRFRAGDRRALMGESLSGLFVVDTFLKGQGLFNDYIAVSPSLWWDDRLPLRRLTHKGSTSLPSNERLYLAVANEGGTMQNGVNLLRSFLRGLPSHSITVRYADFSQSATHSTVYHRAAEEALRWLYPAPPYGGPTPWYMIKGASPP